MWSSGMFYGLVSLGIRDSPSIWWHHKGRSFPMKPWVPIQWGFGRETAMGVIYGGQVWKLGKNKLGVHH